MITIGNDNQPWGYIDLLNECIKILLTVALGIALAYFKVFDAETFVPQTIKFVFRVALPFHIIRGIGINVDFYNPKFQWNFIVAFLLLRAIALVVSFGWVLSSTFCRGNKDTGIGQVAVFWLLLTWVSSVIMGVPISSAIFGTDLGLFFGLVRNNCECP
jgi:predicted permease